VGRVGDDGVVACSDSSTSPTAGDEADVPAQQFSVRQATAVVDRPAAAGSAR
jgi:hypothetical protein